MLPVSQPQTVRSVQHPFNHLHRYSPASHPDILLYRTLKEAVPIIDAAIQKIIRLVGGFHVRCSNIVAEKQLSHFISSVPAGTVGTGIDTFLATYLDQLLTFGTAIGEIVLNSSQSNIYGLYNAPLENVSLTPSENGMGLVFSTSEDGVVYDPVSEPSLILATLLNPEPAATYGISLLRGLPFVTDILTKIYYTIGVNWERVGNLRFAVTYKPSAEAGDRAYARESASQIAREWSNAMQSRDGRVSDFVAVGDVNVKVIGADNQILDSQIPVRQMLEQIVAKLGIPPFLLGLSWSSTERMSAQQSDILTSELEAYRRLLSPVITKICRLWLRLNGFSETVEIHWDNINLQDELELARAELIRAQTQKLLKECEA